MDKAQAIHRFWSSFGMPAYDENSVPTTGDASPAMPYITYNVVTDNIDNDVGLYASIWYKSTSWESISKKAEEVGEALYTLSPIKIDGGYLWLKRGSPFAQRMSDPSDDMVRRIYINITAEYLTAD